MKSKEIYVSDPQIIKMETRHGNRLKIGRAKLMLGQFHNPGRQKNTRPSSNTPAGGMGSKEAEPGKIGGVYQRKEG